LPPSDAIYGVPTGCRFIIYSLDPVLRQPPRIAAAVVSQSFIPKRGSSSFELIAYSLKLIGLLYTNDGRSMSARLCYRVILRTSR